MLRPHAIDEGSMSAVEVAKSHAVRPGAQEAMQGIDAIDVEANVAALLAADERGRRSKRLARAGVTAVLQHKYARYRYRGGFVQISRVHANALACRILATRSISSAKLGVFVDAGNRIGKPGKLD